MKMFLACFEYLAVLGSGVYVRIIFYELCLGGDFITIYITKLCVHVRGVYMAF